MHTTTIVYVTFVRCPAVGVLSWLHINKLYIREKGLRAQELCESRGGMIKVF